MTLKNNRAPLISNIKLCASFHHHMWIQTGFMVRKRLNWVLTFVTLTFDCLTLTFRMDITFVICDNSWKFHEDTMMGTWWKRCDRRTNRLNHLWSCLVAAKNIVQRHHFHVSCHSQITELRLLWEVGDPQGSTYYISLVWCKTAVTPLLMHWS